MKPPSHLSSCLFALLLGVAACGSEAAVSADAGIVPTDTSRLDTPVTPDVSVLDGPAEACVRPDLVRLAARVDCGPRADGGVCPTGYACLDRSGVVLKQFCGRSCGVDCDCPAGERCGSYVDKAGPHPLCVDANAR